MKVSAITDINKGWTATDSYKKDDDIERTNGNKEDGAENIIYSECDIIISVDLLI